jgi:hypothetical protein
MRSGDPLWMQSCIQSPGAMCWRCGSRQGPGLGVGRGEPAALPDGGGGPVGTSARRYSQIARTCRSFSCCEGMGTPYCSRSARATGSCTSMESGRSTMPRNQVYSRRRVTPPRVGPSTSSPCTRWHARQPRTRYHRSPAWAMAVSMGASGAGGSRMRAASGCDGSQGPSRGDQSWVSPQPEATRRRARTSTGRLASPGESRRARGG